LTVDVTYSIKGVKKKVRASSTRASKTKESLESLQGGKVQKKNKRTKQRRTGSNKWKRKVRRGQRGGGGLPGPQIEELTLRKEKGKKKKKKPGPCIELSEPWNKGGEGGKSRKPQG